jgi:hypothetical protein
MNAAEYAAKPFGSRFDLRMPHVRRRNSLDGNFFDWESGKTLLQGATDLHGHLGRLRRRDRGRAVDCLEYFLRRSRSA